MSRIRPTEVARPSAGTRSLLGGALILATTIAGCGSQATTAAVFHPLRPPISRPRPRRPARHRPSLGATERVKAGATTLSVTVGSVVDPLRGSRASLLPGTRAVGVNAEVRNDGPGVYDSSSTGDFSIVPSSGSATPVFAPSGACATPLRDWDNDISTGELRTGCVAFALNAHARVLTVRFSPHAAAPGRGTWLVHR
jgi:hypothetical protein